MIRGCAECGQRDNHPRHVYGILNRPGAVPPTPRHIDCCASTGCELCVQSVKEFDGKTGQALIDYLAAQRAARTEEN